MELMMARTFHTRLLVTVPEVASAYGVSAQTVHRWLNTKWADGLVELPGGLKRVRVDFLKSQPNLPVRASWEA